MTAPRLELTWRWRPFELLTSVQVYEMLQLRQDVFLLEQRCFYRDADGLDLRCWHALGTAARGELCACARLLPPGVVGDEPSIGRVVVASAWRSRGVGGALMSEAIAFARARYPGSPLRISAQAHLEGFYARLGFVRSGDVYDDAGIPHCEMRFGDLRSP